MYVSTAIYSVLYCETLLKLYTDTGVGCKETDLDVSLAVFKRLSNDDLRLGRVSVQWTWLDDAPV